MPDTPLPVLPSDAEVEAPLLAAAIKEARDENIWHPHAVVREHLTAEIARLRAKQDKPGTPGRSLGRTRLCATLAPSSSIWNIAIRQRRCVLRPCRGTPRTA